MKLFLTFFLFSFLLLGSCKPKQKADDDFDKLSFMSDLADQCIITNYEELIVQINDLELAYSTFLANQNGSNFNALKTAWKNAYLKWQSVEGFEFGPAMTNGLRAAVATFPTDTTKLLNNISAGSYDLSLITNLDAIGFSSLDFLFFRTNAINYFSANTVYQQYTADVIHKMKLEVDQVKNQWLTFRSTFINSTGTESTSLFSIFINEFNKEYELCKNAKLGIPIGRQSLGIPQPNYLEARNSGISLELLRANILALKNIYLGGTGMGCDDYLHHLEKGTTSNQIIDRFDLIISQIDNLNGTLEELISSNPAALETLYNTMQGLVVLIKTDMASNFGVLITYQDNDGD